LFFLYKLNIYIVIIFISDKTLILPEIDPSFLQFICTTNSRHRQLCIWQRNERWNKHSNYPKFTSDRVGI